MVRTREVAGGGRAVEVEPERLAGWFDRFAARHGGLVMADGTGGRVRFRAADGASAEVAVPFGGLPLDPVPGARSPAASPGVGPGPDHLDANGLVAGVASDGLDANGRVAAAASDDVDADGLGAGAVGDGTDGNRRRAGGVADGKDAKRSDPSGPDAGGSGPGGSGPGGSGPGGSGPGGSDAGGSDAGGSDAGGSDAGGSDAGGPDAGGPDAGGPDAGGPDSGGADPRVVLDALHAHLAVPRRVGIVLVRLGGYSVGVALDGAVQVSSTGARPVHGRNRKGGSSSGRFARRRDNQARVALDAAADAVIKVLVPVADTLDAVVVGGDTGALNDLRADRRLAALLSRAEPRVLDVPEPRRAVLDEAAQRARAVEIVVRDPAP